MKNILKKIAAAAMCAAMVCVNTACISPESIKFVKDGTYIGVAPGYSGDIEVSVTYKDNRMTDVQITNNSESGSVAYSAMKDIPAYILENQSVNVDVSTGATTTSKAICAAVANTVEPAGGNIEQWKVDCAGKHADKVVDYTTEVVIVGGGYSGLVTALRLQQLGIKTLIVEKQPKVSGSLNYMFQAMQITAGSKELHKDNVADSDPETIANDIYTYGNQEGNEELIQLLANNIGRVTDWQIKDLGIAFEDKYSIGGYTTNTIRYYNTDDSELYELLRKEIEVSGSKVVTNASVIGIDYEDGTPSGVTAKAINGDVIKVKADYVVLASGSYGENQSLLNTETLPYYGPLGDTGDMISLGKSELNNFNILSQEGVISQSTGYQLTDTQAVDSYNAIQRCIKQGAFIMNQDSLRFINEDAEKNVLSTAINTQSKTYIVMNYNSYRAFKAGLLVNMSEEQRNEVLGTESTSNMDNLYQADNLQVACEKQGLDYAATKEAIEQYNAMVEAKKDSTYGRKDTTFESTIDETEECYIVPITKYIYSTLGGISCNTTLNVLKTDGSQIDNVYVIGSACGNVFGSAVKQGTSSAWAVTSAYVVAENILDKYNLINGVIESPSPSPEESATPEVSEDTAPTE